MTRARRKRYTWRSMQRAMAVATMSPEHIPGRRFSSCTKNIPTVSGRKKRPTGSNDAASPRKKKKAPRKNEAPLRDCYEGKLRLGSGRGRRGRLRSTRCGLGRGGRLSRIRLVVQLDDVGGHVHAV